MEKIKYRYTATGRTGSRILTPVNSSAFAVSYNQNDERLDYVAEFSDKLEFVNEDFIWLYMLEKTIYRCDFIYLKIEKLCGGMWTDFFDGRLSLNSGDSWNLHKKTVELSISESTKYDCLDDGFDTEIKLLQNIFTRKAVKSLTGELEFVTFDQTAPIVGGAIEPFPGEPDPYSKGWVMNIQQYRYEDDMPDTYRLVTGWVREKLIVPVSTVLTAPWIEIDNDGTNVTYVRNPILYNPSYDIYNPQKPNDSGVYFQILSANIDNGLPLKTVVDTFLLAICPNLTIESDFFQWNPENPSPINYVTLEPSKVLNLVLFQKSDVKRPYTDNNASIGAMTFEDLINGLCRIFQLKYEITDSGKLKIEHVDYYRNRGIGLDTTLNQYRLDTAGNQVYSYDKDKLPKRETFRMMEAGFGDFTGTPITYSGSCVGQGDNDEINYNVEKITTDVQLCLNNPSPDSIVSDDGFVLIACDASDTILRQPSILGGNVLNNTLAWSRLHLDYWKYNRPQKVFQMNNELTTAFTVKPIKLQADFSVPLCCIAFDPKRYIKSSLGNEGLVKSAVYSLYSENIKLSLLFDAEDGLIDNDAPTTIGDAAETFKNNEVIIDVLSNDIDTDGVIVPSTLAIIFNPSNGTAVITPDYKIKYTPNTDYVGGDNIVYTVKDNLNEQSPNTIVIITVKDGTPEIEANDDSYSIPKNVVLNKVAPGLLSNDTGPSALTTAPETKPTAQGGSVSINNDGSFDYTPPVDFIGTDNFSYTALDVSLNPDVAVCEIDVFEPVDIYVSMEETGDLLPSSIIEACSGVPTVVGEQKKNNYTLYFWSDAAKTIPIDVTNYGLKIKVRYDYYDHGVISGGLDSLINAVGTSIEFQTNYLTYYRYFGCSSTSDINNETSLSLQPGTGYNI